MEKKREKFWIVIGDIHDDISQLKNIPCLKDAQGLIISGDLTNYGGKAQAEKITSELKKVGLPILAQIGNMDLLEVNAWLDKKGVNLHGHTLELAPGIAIFGGGGSTPTPMNTPTEFPEAEYAKIFESEWQNAKHYPMTVFISHNPPRDTACDKLENGMHVGSTAVREFIEKEQPDICICGHIHESRGIDKIGRTSILNPGAFTDGGYVKLALRDDALFAELKQAGK